MEWKEKSKDVLLNRYNLILYSYEDNYLEPTKKVDIFCFDVINNVFKSINSARTLKYNDILGWIAIPEFEE